MYCIVFIGCLKKSFLTVWLAEVLTIHFMVLRAKRLAKLENELNWGQIEVIVSYKHG